MINLQAVVIEKLPRGVKRIIFLEEEIRSGGMGMNLADKLGAYLCDNGISYGIVATDDSFVCAVNKGQMIYDAAGVGKADICKAIRALK